MIATSRVCKFAILSVSVQALLVCSLVAQANSDPPPTSSDAMQHLQAGIEAYKQQHLDIAIAEFRRATELDPTQAAGFLNLGQAYLQNHQNGEAIGPLKQALVLNPELPAAQQLLGYALLAEGYAAESIPHLEKVHEFGALGIAQIESGQPSEAVTNLQKALAQSPNDPDLIYYLSQASEMLSRRLVDTLLIAYPDSDRAHQSRAQSYFVLRQLPQAEKEYQQALALRPDVPGLHLELGEVYAASSQWSEAEEQFRAEIALQPANAEAAFHLGDVFMQEGKMREALTELELSDQLRPEMSETLYSLGKAASLAGDSEVAEKSWKRVIEIEKESSLAAQSHFGLAALYRKQGKAAEAEKETQEFRRLNNRISQP